MSLRTYMGDSLSQIGPVDFVDTIVIAYSEWVEANPDANLENLLSEDQVREIGKFIWNNRYVVNTDGLVGLVMDSIAQNSKPGA